MKNLTLCMISLLASIQICGAGLLEDIEGKWKLNGTSDGIEITTVFKRVGQKGLTRKSTIVIPGLPDAIDVAKYKANGTVRGSVKRGGVVQNSFSGTWRIRGNKLFENVVVSSPVSPDVRQKTTVKLANPRKLTTVNVLNGDRTTGSLTRLR